MELGIGIRVSAIGFAGFRKYTALGVGIKV